MQYEVVSVPLFGGGTENRTVTFTHNRNRENIKSGETHSTIFGKIARYFADLKLVAFTGSYNDLNGKPSSFPPSSHTHTKSQVSDFAHNHTKAEITDFPTSMPASDVYSWAKAANKPSYSWSDITNKPTELSLDNIVSTSGYAGEEKTNINIESYGLIIKWNNTIKFNFDIPYNKLLPGDTNKFLLGDSNYRWKDIYSINSVSTTSDRNLKTRISYIGQDCGFDDTYMSDECVYSFVMGLLSCVYQRVDADSGRPHHGFIAQDVKSLMNKLGISDHAAFIKSPKYINVEYEEEETYVDETDGQTKTRTVTKTKPELVPGEYIYGLRYEEFIPDITRVIQIQDKKIKEQDTKIKEQDRKINSLEERLSTLENMVKAS